MMRICFGGDAQFTRCDGQVLLHRCSASESNQLGFFREWRARGRRQLAFVHSVVNSSIPASMQFLLSLKM
ncbi:hypothetical protein CRENBAI_020868 [Crenichthys baileyi]|uniref:Uncharacterized protein n=1 Tax=Crenichthys baileyi TaxID=28760 RepID=A0AAV9S3X8_9TELE